MISVVVSVVSFLTLSVVQSIITIVSSVLLFSTLTWVEFSTVTVWVIFELFLALAVELEFTIMVTVFSVVSLGEVEDAVLDTFSVVSVVVHTPLLELVVLFLVTVVIVSSV